MIYDLKLFHPYFYAKMTRCYVFHNTTPLLDDNVNNKSMNLLFILND